MKTRGVARSLLDVGRVTIDRLALQPPFQVIQVAIMMRRSHFCGKQAKDLLSMNMWASHLFLGLWHSVDFPHYGRLFTVLAMADTLRLLGTPGPWEREALSYYHHSLILDTVQPPYDNDIKYGRGKACKNYHIIPFQPLPYPIANIIHTFVFHVPGSLSN